MSLRKNDSLLSSFAFRLTLKYSFLFALMLLLVFIVSSLVLSGSLLKRVDDYLLDEADEIMFLYENRDLAHVRDEILMESLGEGEEEVFYRFRPVDRAGFLESDLSSWQGFDFDSDDMRTPAPEEVSFKTVRMTDGSVNTRLLVKTLRDGSVIQIGIRLEDYYDLLGTYRRIFGWSVLFMIFSGTLLGWLNSHQAMLGVARVTETARSISKGRFDQRVSLGDEGREIDELGHVFNEMITKIEALITEMKDVTNSVAHDLRSPITRIRGMAETTITGPQQIEEYQQFAGLAVEECDRLEAMIDTLLEIAQADAGLVKVAQDPVNLCRIVREGSELFEPVLEDKKISFLLKVPDEDVIAETDAHRLQRVFTNLLDNAVKFTPEGGTIEVALKDYQGYAEILVKDNGIGIPREELGQIFGRFYRCDRSRSVSGNGLGLSLVQSIMRSLNGEVSVISSPGEGSTFTLILPKTRDFRLS